VSEHGEQAAFFEYLDRLEMRHPEYRYAFHIPNGEKRDKATAFKLKSAGVRPGVPDVMVPVVRPPWHGLFLEFKVGRNGLSPGQKAFQAFLLHQGYLVVVVYSSAEAIDAVERYLGVPAAERTRLFGS
jgi:hypothetical protein